jgi:hypothetical protein
MLHKLREKTLVILPIDFWTKKWYNGMLSEIRGAHMRRRRAEHLFCAK